MQFVADLRDVATPDPGARRVVDVGSLAPLIIEETRDRLRAVFAAMPGDPLLMLSGGVDSIFVGAVAVEMGYRPRAVTVVTADGTDRVNAAAAATALGLTHEIIELDGPAVVELAEESVRRLEVAELWEVSYAVPMLAMLPLLERLDTVGPILTGRGADALFAGGKTLASPIDSPAAAAELDHAVRKESALELTRTRLVPDFYPRILGDHADRIIHVFQTVRFWELSETFAPPALFGTHDGHSVDKLCLRIACEELLPTSARPLAWAKKSAIQHSAGIMGALSAAARTAAANLPGAQTYTDPLTEPFEAVATRLFLDRLADNAKTPTP
ncbi:asparagine synthase-related protein [Nocardia sp. CDC153]|uniref:asparagine synthase-related protein n=1 Tax=Nocardia sp. CDC153 TaxID=3112167 RepID=UPI002DBC153D|nr:asparagine synthase-related protein [Nocardia sp. CDC153]MEC3957553.1 asparagine synthase-related protein [Nocardia sp. CDC153]